MSTIELTVPNISCNHCVHTIQTELSELAGVRRVQADAASKQVTVQFEPPASEAQIEALLTEIGYPGQPLLTL